MKIFEFNYLEVPELDKPIHLCLGFFDGIHLGHQSIIKTALEKSSEVGVLTFDESPAYLLGRKPNNEVLTSPADKAEILEDLGVKYLFVLHVDQELLDMDRSEFIWQVLKLLTPEKIYCGQDYKFGKDGLGDPTYLKQFFDVQVFPILKQDGYKVSSRDIAEYVRLGEFDMANSLLGRNYFITGIVAQGRQIGRSLGFPTANIEPDYNVVLPKEGVYAGYALILRKKYKAVISYSRQPTFGILENPVLEVHILDFNEAVYGRLITIQFVRKLRDINRFNHRDLLTEQLKKDIENTKNLLK